MGPGAFRNSPDTALLRRYLKYYTLGAKARPPNTSAIPSSALHHVALLLVASARTVRTVDMLLTCVVWVAQHPDLIEKRRKLYADRIRRYMPGAASPEKPPVPRHPGPSAAQVPDMRRRNTGP